MNAVERLGMVDIWCIAATVLSVLPSRNEHAPASRPGVSCQRLLCRQTSRVMLQPSPMAELLRRCRNSVLSINGDRHSHNARSADLKLTDTDPPSLIGGEVINKLTSAVGRQLISEAPERITDHVMLVSL